MTDGETLSNNGFILLDLLTAITIAGIVLMLCLGFYRSLTRTMSQQGRLTTHLRSAVIVQKRINRAMENLSAINRCTEHELIGIEYPIGKPVILRFTGSVLLCGTDTVARQLERFVFTLVENRNNHIDHDAILLWNGMLANNNWIGGATTVVTVSVAEDLPETQGWR